MRDLLNPIGGMSNIFSATSKTKHLSNTFRTFGKAVNFSDTESPLKIDNTVATFITKSQTTYEHSKHTDMTFYL